MQFADKGTRTHINAYNKKILNPFIKGVKDKKIEYSQVKPLMNTQYGADVHNTSSSPAIHILNRYHFAFPQKERKQLMKTNNITYRQVGDYTIPNLTLPPEEANICLGKWGMLHKDYLLKHKPVVFATLLAQGKLWQYLADIDTQAKQMFDMLVEQMKRRDGVTEQMKEENQMEWMCRLGNIEVRVNEIIFLYLVYQFNEPNLK